MAENTPAATDDPFGRPTRSAFPKIEELEGRLVLIKPSKVEYKVKGKYGEQTRVTADVVVLDDPDEGVVEHDDMYLSQKGLTGMLESCLKPGRKPFVLGRVQMTPTKEYAEAAEKAGDGDGSKGIGIMLKEYFQKGGKGEKPQFFWDLADFTDEDANRARNYLASNDQFATAAS